MIKKKYPNLFSPIKIRGNILRNRIVTAPMLAPGTFNNGLPTDKAAAFFGERAQGGPAVVTIGESPVNYTHAMSRVLTNCLSDIFLKEDYFRRITYAINRHGAIASIQLYHIGMACRTPNVTPLGPSASVRDDGSRVEEMTREQIREVIGDFARCAENAKLTGFNMIQLHGGHGWLLSQFASPAMNKRTDEYGGSVRNRVRFARELLDAVRERVGWDFIIEYRISGDEMIDGGMKIDDTIEFIKEIEDKIDIIHISVGTMWNLRSDNYMFPLWYIPHGCNVGMAAKVKKAVTECAVAVVGGISDPAQAEEIIASGKADLVAINRGLVADPNWCNKAMEGRDDEIIPCIRCISCHDYVFVGEGAFCSVNPRTLQELWLGNVPEPKEKRKVVVVGGGVGGMQAAITASERGHDVVLFEKSGELGGIMKFTDRSAVKKDLKRFKDYQIRMVNKLGVDVRMNTEATPDMVMAENPYAVIAAVGSDFIVPDIPGIKGKNVMSALEAYQNQDKLGKAVAIIGGNLTGVELGIDLAAIGKDVTVVEMTDKIAANAPMFYKAGIEEELDMHKDKLTCKTGMTCISISDKGVQVKGENAEEMLIPADSVIYAVGMRPREELAESFRDTCLRFRSIGDCYRVRKLRHAVEGGFHAVLDIL